MVKALAAVICWLCVAVPALALSPSDVKKPTWKDLTPAQQQVLAPLRADWDTLDTVRRKKWVGIAERYPKMKPEEQKRVQERMRDWAKLTPEQRRVARQRYQALAKLPPKQRQEIIAKWNEARAAQEAQPA